MSDTALSDSFISAAKPTAKTSPRLIVNPSGSASPFGAPLSFNKPLGPFAILYEDRAITDSAIPKKYSRPWPTKAERSAISFETPEERTERRLKVKAAKTAKVLVVNQYSDVGRNCPTQADRTNVITGKRITARHQ